MALFFSFFFRNFYIKCKQRRLLSDLADCSMDPGSTLFALWTLPLINVEQAICHFKGVESILSLLFYFYYAPVMIVRGHSVFVPVRLSICLSVGLSLTPLKSLCTGNQLLPEFSSNQFETLHRCCQPIDVHVTF